MTRVVRHDDIEVRQTLRIIYALRVYYEPINVWACSLLFKEKKEDFFGVRIPSTFMLTTQTVHNLHDMPKCIYNDSDLYS